MLDVRRAHRDLHVVTKISMLEEVSSVGACYLLY